MQIEVTNRRNQHGVKDSCDQYRTICGEHYIQWAYDFNKEMINSYRGAGLKCYVVKGELYIRKSDVDAAVAIDKSREAH